MSSIPSESPSPTLKLPGIVNIKAAKGTQVSQFPGGMVMNNNRKNGTAGPGVKTSKEQFKINDKVQYPIVIMVHLFFNYRTQNTNLGNLQTESKKI